MYLCSTSGRGASALPSQCIPSSKGHKSQLGAAACRKQKLAGSCQLSRRTAALAPQLRCRAAGRGSGGEEEPQLSEEELKQMEEDLLKEFMEGMGADDPESKKYESKGTLNFEQTVEAMQMGSWRLKGLMDAPFEGLESQIEGLWREILGNDLQLYPLKPEFKYCDSMDPLKESGEQSYKDLRPPDKGDPLWPRMQLENRCYCSRVFRKLHMELVHRQDGFQVLHCVMFPRLEYDLPILGMDMVGVKGRISLAVLDCSPVAMDRSLPPVYAQGVRQLQAQYNMENNRTTPEWGNAIFSEMCVIMRPVTSGDLADFMKYAIALSRMHMQLARLVTPVQHNRQRRLADISAAHERYSLKQLENDKTTRVLEAGFGKEFAERYMQEVMFDYKRAVEETLKP